MLWTKDGAYAFSPVSLYCILDMSVPLTKGPQPASPRKAVSKESSRLLWLSEMCRTFFLIPFFPYRRKIGAPSSQFDCFRAVPYFEQNKICTFDNLLFLP